MRFKNQNTRRIIPAVELSQIVIQPQFAMVINPPSEEPSQTSTNTNHNNNNIPFTKEITNKEEIKDSSFEDLAINYEDFSEAESDGEDEGKRVIKRNIDFLEKTAPSLSNGSLKEEDINASTEFFVKCPQCHKGCQTFQALKEHLEIAHAELSTPSENGLSVGSAVSPIPMVSGGRYGCSQCSSSFSSKEQLEKHELLHSPNAQVSCKICNKTFANVYRLQRHMISHDESAVLRKFKCTECDKAFKFKHHLKEHIRIHSGEKPFECGNCGKRFSHSGSYSSHMTSKKCLVMNLKLGRSRPSMLDKNLPHSLKASKRPLISPINNNLATSPNHNSPYMPILPKYSDSAAMFQHLAAGNSSMAPFYLTPHGLLNTAHPISPYSASALGHLLEQLQQQAHQHQQQQRTLDTPESIEDHSKMQEDKLSVVASESREDFDDLSKSANPSECGELVMDEEETLIKQENQENVDVDDSNHSNAKEQYPCALCKQIFTCSTQLEEHECRDVQSEGLAAKLEAALTPKSETEAMSGTEDQDPHDEMDAENYATTDHVNEDGRKVRVRSLISEDQLRILKEKYRENPRPKREDLEKIASSIRFPVRVVQVWFQNTRARDRREGRVIQVHYSPNARYPQPPQPMMSPQYGMSEQPLDLSIKRGTSSHETSPNSSPMRLESHDEAVNLSHKSSRSPTPYLPYHNHFQNSNSSEPRQSPSPLDYNSSRLAQILAQPKLGMPPVGMVPMDQLLQFSHDIPSLSQLISSRMSNLSPSQSPNDHLQDEDLMKRTKVQQLLFKNMGSSGIMQEQEMEGQFQCDQCDKAFSKPSSLARHKYEHSGQRPHKCDECPKAFKHKHHLTEHKRLHSGEKPFQCSKCLKRFSHSGSYSQHMNHRYSYCKPYRE